METIYQDILDVYQNDARPVFDEFIIHDRGEEFVDMLASDALYFQDASFSIEAEAIGAL